MMMTVGVAQAHNRLSELIERVEKGDVVQIARRGVPVAQIQPISSGRDASGNGAAIAELLSQRLNSRHRHPSANILDSRIAKEREAWG